jgi:hypothetical protein
VRVYRVRAEPRRPSARPQSRRHLRWQTNQLDLFEHQAQQAMVLAPYDAEILATLGVMIALSGQWQRRVALANRANELNAEAAQGWYHGALLFDYYLKGD